MKLFLVRLSIAILGTVLAVPTPAADADTRPPLSLDDGVWIDSTRGTVALMRAGGGIEMLDLTGGRRLWLTTEADAPIAIGPGVVFARRQSPFKPGRLPLVALDARDGRVLASTELALPTDVYATLDRGPRAGFDVRAWFADGKLTVEWERWQVPKRRRDDRRYRAPEERRGAASLSWPGFGGTALRSEELAPSLQRRWGRGPLPDEAPDARPHGEQLLATRWPSPGVVEVLRYSLEGGHAAGSSRIDLLEGFQRRYPSLDGRHFLTSRRDDPDGTDPRFTWAIHDLETGRVAARLQAVGPGGRFVVLDDLVVHAVRRPVPAEQRHDAKFSSFGLRAVRLRDGVELWRTFYRDVRHRGSLPSLPHGGAR